MLVAAVTGKKSKLEDNKDHAAAVSLTVGRIKAYLGKLHELKKFNEWTKVSGIEPHKVLKFPLEEQTKYEFALTKYWHDVSGKGGGLNAFPAQPKPGALNLDDGNWNEI